MSLQGAPNVVEPVKEGAKKPAPGRVRVKGLAHYGKYMAGERYTVSFEEYDLEMKNKKPRFVEVARGPKPKKVDRTGRSVGLRGARVG